jgi:hypothetical protein
MADDWRVEVEDIGEAWANEFSMKPRGERAAQGGERAAQGGERAAQGEALGGTSGKEEGSMRYRMYRTASTRAFKRAIELLVGDLNSLLKGLAILYGHKQANGKGALKPLPPEAAPIIRALGAGEMGVMEVIKGLTSVVGNGQNVKSHEGQA